VFREFTAGNAVGERRGMLVGNILLEALLVAMIGAVVAFAANAISPRGLNLARDYFPNAHVIAPLTVAATNGAPTAARSNALSPAERLATRFREEGLQLADSNQAIKLFHDPRYSQGLVIFVDARNDEHYQAGHVPGAYQLDHFRPTDYLASALPACQMAEAVIVSCNGGECDDSENTAILLRDAGIPKEKLFVYAGGIEEWAANRMPIETGARNSGNLRNSTPSK
jgi:rhodanese-related sulfurtransferase